jgi:hypothetical protein
MLSESDRRILTRACGCNFIKFRPNLFPWAVEMEEVKE